MGNVKSGLQACKYIMQLYIHIFDVPVVKIYSKIQRFKKYIYLSLFYRSHKYFILFSNAYNI